ncbi:MAG: major facilitator superfamily MFS_1 [uncultured Nocardioidaceae bacterium]|uniref:Major facilitator superfamily MFS_1 n=1 Tax=uncultured Nocardioidaceae bacterium TaxID=253824 RepID=A0A6J4MCQ6_9ACTN|nr:MAG: major facilitator superfamily MFS_1 [uncultured Nocardioidaceae bacterium]
MTASAHDVERLQQHTVRVLVGSQALGGLGTTVGIAVASVLARDVSGSESLAGLAQTVQVLGAALGSYLVARLMGRRGRRIGLVTGYLVGASGAAICVVGGAVRSFPVLLLGALLLGATTATGLQARYAATDLALPARRARALSTVLWATTLGAVAGPNLVGPAGRLASAVGLPRLTGPFLVSVVAVLLAAGVVAAALRPDPLLVAKELATRATPGAAASGVVSARVAWRRLQDLARTSPGVGAGILAVSAAQAVMVAVMIMTPLHMDHGGAALQVIGLVISIHVLGMFFFSPLVGWLADRAGRPVTLLLGAGVLWTALVLAGSSPAGTSFRIGAGLFLLGLGWSCCTIAGSALVTESTPLTDRTDVQGAADLVMNVVAAAAGVLAGVVVDGWGFTALNAFAGVLVLGVLLAVARSRRADVLVA